MSVYTRIRLGRISHAAQHTLDRIDETVAAALDCAAAPVPTLVYAPNHWATASVVGRYRRDVPMPVQDILAAGFRMLTPRRRPQIIAAQGFPSDPNGITPKPFTPATIERIRAGMRPFTQDQPTDQPGE